MNRIAASLLGALAISLPALFDSTVKATALLVFIACVVLLMRKASAAARHLAWVLGVLGLLLLPLLAAVLPGWRVLPSWAAVSLAAHPKAAPATVAFESNAQPPPADSSVVALPPLAASTARVDRTPPVAHAIPIASPALSPLRNAGEWLGAVWLAGATLLLLRLAGSAFVLRRSARNAQLVTTGPLRDALEEALRELRMRRRVLLLIDERRIVPLVWGIFRARLVLPGEARDWDDARLRAVLLHELAHLKRGDLIVMLLTHLACAAHWFNPLVWLAAWRLHVERERACDDLVLTAGIKASDYAEHLLHVATKLDSASPVGALGMASPSRLEGRLLAVLNQHLRRGGVPTSVALAAIALGLGIIIPVAMLRAQENSAPRPEGRGTGRLDVIQGSTAGAPPSASEIPTAPADGTVQQTSRAGRWLLGGGMIMDVHQNIFHGADVASDAVLWWPARPDRPALRHEFSLAADAFGNREPWKMAWEANGTVLWIAIGETRFMGMDRDKKYKIARIRRVDFSDPSAIKETHWAAFGPMPEAIQAGFAAEFELPAAGEPGQEQVYTSPARLEHTWVVTGATRNAAGQPLPNVPIALTLENERYPFEQMRSDAKGNFWTSLRPPLTALTKGCVITVKGNPINGIVVPAEFQEATITLTAAEVARHVAAGEPAAGSAAFQGTIKSPKGDPFPGALIAVIADGETVTGFTSRADKHGKFRLPAVPADRGVSVLVEASPQKRRGNLGGIRIAAGEVLSAKLTLAPGREWEWNLVLNKAKPEEVEQTATPDGASASPEKPKAAEVRPTAPEAAPPTAGKVPLLAEIPILGPLFRTEGKNVLEAKEDGGVLLNDAPIPPEKLGEKLADLAKTNGTREIVIRAAKTVPYQEVLRLLNACKTAGFQKVSMAAANDPAQSSTDAHPAKTASEELTRIHLRHAEENLKRLTELEKQKAVSQEEVDRAKAEVELRKAELQRDDSAVARVRLRHAERTFERTEELHKNRLVSSEERDRAKLELEVRKAEMAGDQVAAARAKVASAEAKLEHVEQLRAQKLIGQADYDALRYELEIARAELKQASSDKPTVLPGENSAEILQLLDEELLLAERKLAILKQEQAAGIATVLPAMRMQAELVALRRAKAVQEGKTAEAAALFDEQIKILEDLHRAVSSREGDAERQKTAIDIQREILTLKREKAGMASRGAGR